MIRQRLPLLSGYRVANPKVFSFNNMLSSLRGFFVIKKLFFIIIVIGIVIRLLGIMFGLPLWIVGDEASFIFGAFKMFELKTFLPVLHDSAFRGTFYYTPYLSYIYMPFFAILASTRWFFFSGTWDQFKLALQLDLTPFFLIGRLLSVVWSTFTIGLLYRVGKNFFKNERIGLYSAVFFALGLLPLTFGHWARHWSAAAFVTTLIIWCLSSNKTLANRYRCVAIIIGVGAGITMQITLLIGLVFFWLVFIDRVSLRRIFCEGWFWHSILIGSIFIAVAYGVWPRGFYVIKNAGETISAGKTFGGLVLSYWFYLQDLWLREPIFLFFLITGSFVSLRHYYKFVMAVGLFLAVYIGVFYLFFLTISRFLMLPYPLLALLAGVGMVWLQEKISKYSSSFANLFVLSVFATLIIVATRFDYLLIKNDTRVSALNWLEHNLPKHAKIAVLVPLLHLTATPDAIKDQYAFDKSSLHHIDLAEEQLLGKFIKTRQFYTFNPVNKPPSDKFFLNDFSRYLSAHNFEYIIYTPEFVKEHSIYLPVGNVIKEFLGTKNYDESLINGVSGNLNELFGFTQFGPNIEVSKLIY